jgi:hypothetical protein
MSHTLVALMAQYLNVRQRKLGTIIIQTVHILQHDIADAGSLSVEDLATHNPSYVQIIQPGRSTVTPPYQWRQQLRTNRGGTSVPMEAADFLMYRLLLNRNEI